MDPTMMSTSFGSTFQCSHAPLPVLPRVPRELESSIMIRNLYLRARAMMFGRGETS